MAERTEMRWCGRCDQTVPVTIRTPSHVMHAVLSLITMGAWLIVWLALIFETKIRPGGRCPKCKGKV